MSEERRFVVMVGEYNTRHYLTHYPQELEHGALHGTELIDTVENPRRLLAFYPGRSSGWSQCWSPEFVLLTR